MNLATRGWQVTGIDLVAKALSTARKRAREAGIQVQFVHGDITALRAAGVGSSFEFFLDLGVVHGLDEADRRAVGRGDSSRRARCYPADGRLGARATRAISARHEPRRHRSSVPRLDGDWRGSRRRDECTKTCKKG